ncbi:MAG: hypothetical protein K2X87_33500 [Gemmataceae bacterium]|nr:hypothetical protein [Gemmataceae bacterium]
MTDWVPFSYRGYHDVPRIILVRRGGQVFLFNCPFSVELDDYPDEYEVFLLPPDTHEENLPTDWTLLRDSAVCRLGSVPVDRVTFDPTRQKFLDGAILDEVAGAAVPPVGWGGPS